MPYIGLKQGHLIGQYTSLLEMGHGKFQFIYRKSENIPRLPVMANDQASNIRLPPRGQVRCKLFMHFFDLLRENLES